MSLVKIKNDYFIITRDGEEETHTLLKYVVSVTYSNTNQEVTLKTINGDILNVADITGNVYEKIIDTLAR